VILLGPRSFPSRLRTRGPTLIISFPQQPIYQMKEEMLHLVAVDRGGGECDGGCEDKSVCAWEDKILSAFMVKKSDWRE
ncbi:hypothetical protein Tco_0244898, partial [Tanacetum coccineum]